MSGFRILKVLFARFWIIEFSVLIEKIMQNKLSLIFETRFCWRANIDIHFWFFFYVLGSRKNLFNAEFWFPALLKLIKRILMGFFSRLLKTILRHFDSYKNTVWFFENILTISWKIKLLIFLNDLTVCVGSCLIFFNLFFYDSNSISLLNLNGMSLLLDRDFLWLSFAI